MLRRIIGEDIQLAVVGRPGAGRGEGRPRPDRAGDHEPGGQRPRRHAAGGQAHHRDCATSSWTRRYARSARGSPARPVRAAGGQRHRLRHGRRRRRRGSSSRSSPPRGEQGHRAGAGHGLRHRQAERRPRRRLQRGGPRHHLQGLPAARGAGRPLAAKSAPAWRRCRAAARRCCWWRTRTGCAR